MFEHSVRVPRLYKTAANIAKKVKDEGASIKNLVYEKKHPNIKGIYALVVETLQRHAQIDFLLKKSQLLQKEPRLDPWLTRVLITELLWGKKCLKGDAKPIKTVLAYNQILLAHSSDVHESNKCSKVNKPRFVRINTIKLSTEEAVDSFRDEGWTLSRFTESKKYELYLEKLSTLDENEFVVDIHIKDMLVFAGNTQFYKHPAYLDNCIILQDKASCLPVQILNPPVGSTVLDMCAAPGMKTTQIAAAVKATGVVYAVEMDQKRMNTLTKMIESFGASWVKTLNKDVLTLTGDDVPGVEYILVDPSCSGSGIVDRLELGDSTDHTALSRLQKLAGFQIMILKHALRKFPDAKRVVYSTCSIYPQENEAVVQEVLASTTKFKLVPAHTYLDAPWLSFGSNDYNGIGEMCLYARPEVDMTNGFFVAVFEKLEEGETNPFLKETTGIQQTWKPNRADRKRKNLNDAENEGNDEQNGEEFQQNWRNDNTEENLQECDYENLETGERIFKKQKGKAAQGNHNIKENFENTIDYENENTHVKRKKRKGEKVTKTLKEICESAEIEENLAICENHETGELIRKKRRSDKKRADHEGTKDVKGNDNVEEDLTNTNYEEPNSTDVKRKKRKNAKGKVNPSNEETEEGLEKPLNEEHKTAEGNRKKQKRVKTKACQEISENIEVNFEEGQKITKEKRTKRKREKGEANLEKIEEDQFDENTEIVEERKVKNSKAAQKQLIDLDESSIKKKKKRKQVLEGDDCSKKTRNDSSHILNELEIEEDMQSIGKKRKKAKRTSIAENSSSVTENFQESENIENENNFIKKGQQGKEGRKNEGTSVNKKKKSKKRSE